jgi:sulfur-carrier protein
MAVTVHIPGPLRAFTDDQSEVTIDAAGASVGQVLSALWARHPGLRDRVLTETGEVREHLNVFVGEESIRFLDGLATVVPDGADVCLLPAISGG